MSFQLSDFDFNLPERLIAQAPLKDRGDSRLLVVDVPSQKIIHTKFSELGKYLPSRSLLVANNSKVIHARLLGNRLAEDGTLGGRVEFFLLENKSGSDSSETEFIWEGMFHASAKYRRGLKFLIPKRTEIKTRNRDVPGDFEKTRTEFTEMESGLIGELITSSEESDQGLVIAKFSKDPLAEGFGILPLPPYIKRDISESDPQIFQDDKERYQTTYAKELGSVAAPTAGLHFSSDFIHSLQKQGHQWEEVTLHVGLGTFRPMKSADIRTHKMHGEEAFVSPTTAEVLNLNRKAGRPLIAIGTTSMRTLESVWNGNTFHSGKFSTDIYFFPGGNSPRIIDGLITNFHLPKSSLYLLVCAYGGIELMKEAYSQAIREEYRFFSYGDAMLILSPTLDIDSREISKNFEK